MYYVCVSCCTFVESLYCPDCGEECETDGAWEEQDADNADRFDSQGGF